MSGVSDVVEEAGSGAKSACLEPGRVLRWRGRRWRTLGAEDSGVVRLVGLDAGFEDMEVTPLVSLEGDRFAPDELGIPSLDVASTDRSRWRALHRAHLVTMAGGREQLVGLDWGAIAVEPYQLVPLLRVARSLRPRLLIADDTGLGKTAEAGIVLRWLAQRHQAGRVLVVTRAAPEPQRWKSELWTKFGFDFDILASGADFNERRRRNPTVNVFAQSKRLIVSMTLAAGQALLDELRACPVGFDAVIVDEAAHLALTGSHTKRLARLGRVLSEKSEGGALLLLTATPHDGKTGTFLSLLRLLEPFVEVEPGTVPVDVARRLVVRRLKHEVVLAGGRRFQTPEIQVRSTLGDRTRAERALEEPLEAYLALLAERERSFVAAGARQKATGCQFLAGVYRKRFGSSTAALRATLRRRLGLPAADEDLDLAVPYTDSDGPEPEDEVIDPGAEATTPPPELSGDEAEAARALLDAALLVPPGQDSKLRALSSLLAGEIAGSKAVVFTEYRDTLRAAARRLDADGIGYVTFHGASTDEQRREALRRFVGDDTVRVFLATDAASEGINLQRAAHRLVHLDVPWNPSRYAQRNGRIDRYGQDHRPRIWVLVAADRSNRQGRPEARALELVIDKLRLIQAELGSVGAVLPHTASGRVRDILARSETDAEAELDRALGSETGGAIEADWSRLTAQNAVELRSAESYVARLGVHDNFEDQLGELLRSAFRGWDDGGALTSTGEGCYRLAVPGRLRGQVGATVIDRATFAREIAVSEPADGEVAPELLSPSHPVVAATLRELRNEASRPEFAHRFDVEASDTESLVLSFVARFVDGDGRTVDERLEAVEVDADGVVGTDPGLALRRLGVDAPSDPRRVDPERIPPWQRAFEGLVAVASAEASRRAELRRVELVEVATEMAGEEREALALWHREEAQRAELLSFGTATQPSFEQAEAFAARTAALESEAQRRRATLRERTQVKVASVELLGGRLLVRAAR